MLTTGVSAARFRLRRAERGFSAHGALRPSTRQMVRRLKHTVLSVKQSNSTPRPVERLSIDVVSLESFSFRLEELGLGTVLRTSALEVQYHGRDWRGPTTL